ncbi:MAG TPA: prolyl oligopeptidase family serine peptidase [Xanthomonadaceae bacterium]
MKRLLCLAVLLLCVLAPCAEASMREVKPGSVPVLAPDEGLLVVSVSSSESFSTLEISRDGKFLGGDAIAGVGKGRLERLFVATEGDYHWSRIDYPYRYYPLDDDKEFHFHVKHGVINYPGELVYRPRNQSRADIHIANRGLRAIDWLRAKYPDLYAKFAFEYGGHYADSFPAFYRKEREAQPTRTDADLDRTLPLPDPGKLPIPVADLWPKTHIHRLAISPGGDMLAEATYGDASHLDLIDLRSYLSVPLVSSNRGYVDDVDWLGKDILAVSYVDSDADPPWIYVFRIGAADAKGRRSASQSLLSHRGWVLGTSKAYPDHVLVESWSDGGDLQVHAVDIGPDAKTSDPSQFWRPTRIDRGFSGARGWFVDGNGELRGVLAYKDKQLWLYYGSGGHYEPVFKVSDFNVATMSADGSRFYGMSDKDRGQTDLVELDPATGKLSTLYSKPGIDMEGAVFDSRNKIAGAYYHSNGVRVVDYFDDAERNTAARIAKAFPGMTTMIIDRDESATQVVVAVERSDQAARYYHVDLAHSAATLIDEAKPALASKKLAAARLIEVAAADGTRIEAYLTLPVDAAGKAPLVVFPHGGPIGIRDSLEFDPSVQLFASMGYAVLQVNYRGSGGFGRQFREAGERHYGGLIEDDIDAATRAVIKDYPVDASRMCAVGASYGGYSALVSAIRWPERFRCVVSISGVSDQLLMFTASDSTRTANDRADVEKIIGNPATDEARMREFSPLYRYRELKVPVMLAHGTEDQRVDYEHSRRLVRMLNLAGHPPVMLSLVGEGHGGFDSANELVLWKAVAGFLREYLDPPVAKMVPAPAAPATH